MSPSCSDWMREQISAAWLPPLCDSSRHFWKPHVIHVLCKAAELPLPLARLPLYLYFKRWGGCRRWQTRAASELYFVRLMWQDSRKMQNLMNTFQLTARARLHMLTSWMWAFTEKHKLKIGLLLVLASIWAETLQEEKVVKCNTCKMYLLQNYSNAYILLAQTFYKILGFGFNINGQRGK